MLFLARADDPRAAMNRALDRPATAARARPRLLRAAGRRARRHAAARDAGRRARRGSRSGPTRRCCIRALGNLVSNALRYAPRGSSIGVSTTVARRRRLHARGLERRPADRARTPGSASSSAATASTSRAPARPRARGWAWRSSSRSWTLHDGTASVISGPGRARCSVCTFPRRKWRDRLRPVSPNTSGQVLWAATSMRRDSAEPRARRNAIRRSGYCGLAALRTEGRIASASRQRRTFGV